MSADHAHFSEWDAAYVLGALSPADRRVFEEHLAQCDQCTRALAEIAPTLGLLSRVDPVRATSLLGEEVPDAGADAARRVQLVALRVKESARRRWLWSAGLAAAAIVVAVVIAMTTVLFPVLRGAQTVALEPVADVPLSASVELTPAAWGTRIDMICRYLGPGSADTPPGGRPYSLVVTGRDGSTSEVSSWRGLPGTTARLSAASALDPDEIAAVEVRSLANGRVLLRSEFAAPGDQK